MEYRILGYHNNPGRRALILSGRWPNRWTHEDVTEQFFRYAQEFVFTCRSYDWQVSVASIARPGASGTSDRWWHARYQLDRGQYTNRNADIEPIPLSTLAADRRTTPIPGPQVWTDDYALHEIRRMVAPAEPVVSPPDHWPTGFDNPRPNAERHVILDGPPARWGAAPTEVMHTRLETQEEANLRVYGPGPRRLQSTWNQRNRQTEFQEAVRSSQMRRDHLIQERIEAARARREREQEEAEQRRAFGLRARRGNTRFMRRVGETPEEWISRTTATERALAARATYT